MKTILLSGKVAAGRAALIDDHKLEVIAPYTWWILDAPRARTCYAWTQVRIDGRKVTIRMHNLITGLPYVDHADGDGLNNQLYNLRGADQALNNANTRKQTRPTSSRFKGVCWDRSKNRWMASMHIDGKNVYLGRFIDEEEAARAYDFAALATWGPFALINFPH